MNLLNMKMRREISTKSHFDKGRDDMLIVSPVTLIIIFFSKIMNTLNKNYINCEQGNVFNLKSHDLFIILLWETLGFADPYVECLSVCP